MDLSKSARECAQAIETVIFTGTTVEEAMAAMRKKQIHQKIIYFYAVDEHYKLKGVVSTRQLLLAEPNRKIEEIMQDAVLKLRASQTLKEAMELFAEHPLLALPVVDEEGKLIGAIDIQAVFDESIDFANHRSRFDVFQMIGLTLEDGKRPPLRVSYRLRMPWLLCNVFSGIICAVISRYYELVLAKFLLLAFFIPLVLTLSESTSMQSVAQSLQFLRRPRFRWRIAWRAAIREWQLVLLLALTSGLLVGVLSLLWADGYLPSIAIGVGIMGGVAISAIFGIAMPIVLHRFRLDPKMAAGPVVLMIADILTTGFYLAIASWWLL
ncbi:MAG: magnesium transporter [Chlamydiota bacterium]